ncbi:MULTISPECIES: N-acetylglucosamine-6-phosphate deacetylase [Acidiphilium]|uniref:N-acetylglucosamine-6-phosphate deacetylase/N-acetylmuramic acid 6-phosphate etherase,TIGR00274 n=1 Tax=Acidiphilium rubrum TaxID=526 RepID=A0A8G2CL84_ACIRU|nr:MULTISPECIES: N-acetylglucosamine-6-phosphate deacetylase [Acidiphilium]SIQ65907.1 N-acetylglucosamine-6-phosphate deacetylase/N-acetylmuramic acid 6-phosphate etherase,TIGR00274 [Acidiphilium rubrum]
MIIAARRLLIDGEIIGPASLVIEDGRIVRVLDDAPDDADVVLADGVLAPGLIDLHNNGAFGIDCATAGTVDFETLCRHLAECGVSSFLPTVITAPIGDLQAAAGRIDAAMQAQAAAGPGAAMLGLHLEGPFLAPGRRGAHRADWLRVPDAAALDALLGDDAMRRVLRMVTLAPELPGAMAAIGRLVAAGIVVSLGHTDADAACATRAIDAGARLATHVFTAMRPFHHRDPGVVGVALADARIAPCFIADAVHADGLSLRLGFAAAGRRAVAVTDAVSLAGMPEGYAADFGGGSAMVRDGAARRPDGTLTGAVIALDEGVRRLIAAGIAPAAALEAATAAPARALGLTDRGRLAAGLRADLVWFDDAFQVRNCWIAGVAIKPVVPSGRRAATLPLTEAVRTDLDDLDMRTSEAIIATLLAQEVVAQAALRRAAPALARLADAVAARLAAGGRLFYAGAGTSGRLAVLDAVECGPTFSLPPGVIIPLIAGGAAAVSGAVEGAEDDAAAVAGLLADHAIGPGDALVGIAASGATPFTLAAIEAAGRAGALTGSITNSAGPIAAAAGIAVVIATGAEVIAGSTRLSAGTTQKIALNCLSSTVMIRLGKVFGPYMVDLKPSNAKLRLRAARIVAAIAPCERAAAERALADCGHEVSIAIIALRFGLGADAARAHLARCGFRLRAALAADGRAD